MKLEEFLKQFGIKESLEFFNIGRTVFRHPDKTLLAHSPIYSGEPIAHQRGDTFIPSTSFLQHIAKQTKHKVIVDSKGAWMLICGRDIFGKSITKHTNPGINDRAVVLNEHGECLGYGDIVAPLDSKKVVVKRLFDIGDLLRRERKSRQLFKSNSQTTKQ